jgi:hypothetical protein
MMRPLLALLICTGTICQAASASPVDVRPSKLEAAPKRAVQAKASHRPRLSLVAAKRPMRQFLSSASQVAGLPDSFTVHACRRHSRRVVDCAVTIEGRPSAQMRAKLLERSGPRVQLYVLPAAPPA